MDMIVSLSVMLSLGKSRVLVLSLSSSLTTGFYDGYMVDVFVGIPYIVAVLDGVLLDICSKSPRSFRVFLIKTPVQMDEYISAL